MVIALEEIYQQGYINGFSVGVVNADGIHFTKGIGFSSVENQEAYTGETITSVASVSKTVIGVALLKAQELGKLHLDDPINTYLPFVITNPKYPSIPLTLRQLATHTSSIEDGKNYYNNAYILRDSKERTEGKILKNFNDAKNEISLADFLQKTLDQEGDWYSKRNFAKTAPGSSFSYSNIGAALAAYVIERATEQSFKSFTETYIFKPLEMENTGWDYNAIASDKHTVLYENPTTAIAPYQLVTYPDGGLRTSVNDLSRFLQELIRGYKGEGTLLNQKSYQELFIGRLEDSHFKKRNAENPYNDEYNSGIFMGLSATGNVGHTGSDPGVATFMFFDSKTLFGRILLVNTDLGNDGVKEFIQIWDALGKYVQQINPEKN